MIILKMRRRRANDPLIIFSPTIFWRLSQVLFRGTWTYQKVEPTFTKVPQQNSSLSISEVEEYNSSTQQEEEQNPTIDRLTNSMIAMKDEAIAAMKDAFNALRMEELNGPDPSPVTEKLKGEIDSLKRENEALKRGSQDIGEEKAPSNFQNPDWLQGSRKRPWTDEFPNGRTRPIIQCSQTDDDDMTDSQLVHKPQQTMHLPFNDDDQQTSFRNDSTSKQTTPEPSNKHTEVNDIPDQTRNPVNTSHKTLPGQRNTIVKRLRLSNESATETLGTRKGRPKRSNTAPRNKPLPTLLPKEQPVKRKPGRPRGSSVRRMVQVVSDDDNDDPLSRDSSKVADDAQGRPPNHGKAQSPGVQHASEKENTSRTTKKSQRNKVENVSSEKHRQLVAMRDRMAEEAMRHEEEMAAEVGYYG